MFEEKKREEKDLKIVGWTKYNDDYNVTRNKFNELKQSEKDIQIMRHSIDDGDIS